MKVELDDVLVLLDRMIDYNEALIKDKKGTDKNYHAFMAHDLFRHNLERMYQPYAECKTGGE